MPNMLDVGGQAPVMDPAEVQRRQKLAQVLMQNGQDPGNMRHWSQALGAVLNTGAGVYQSKQAADGLAQGQQAGNKALGQLLMGGDGKAALSNPYSADKAMDYQVSQQNAARRSAEAERLMKMKIDSRQSSPVAENKPASVKEWEYYNSLPQDQRQQYLAMKRADPMDKAYATQYGQQVLGGGNVDAAKNLSQLRDVQGRLESGKENLTGPMLGMVPDSVKAYTNPGAVDAKDTVEEVVQRNLREILGAQFTQKEGDRLIARAYNPSLEEKDNAKRVARLATAMEEALKAKQAAATYFQKNGTMRGFQGKTQWSVADFEKAMDANTDKELPVLSDPSQAKGLPSGTRFKNPNGDTLEVP